MLVKQQVRKGDEPYSIYLLRLSEDSLLFQSTLLPQQAPVLLALSTLDLSERSRVLDLLDQALASRKEQDIKLYVTEIYSRVEREKGGAGEKAIKQLAREWGTCERTIREWVGEAVDKVKVESGAAESGKEAKK